MNAEPTFYLGAKPNFIYHTDKPLFVADPHLRNRKNLPRARGPIAIDSGGFTQLSTHGTWDNGPSPRQYAHQVRRYRDEMGIAWAAPQDWMCEDAVIHGGHCEGRHFPGTGLSVEEHLHRTVGNYIDLMSIDDTLPIIPVVQGRLPHHYELCCELYDRAGVDLAKQPVVGVGSVCRIQDTEAAVDIIECVAGIVGTGRIHGFGFKVEGLRRVAHFLGSADSHAWSRAGRYEKHGCDFRLPNSRGPHSSEANCLRYALAWREDVLTAIRTGVAAPWQAPLFSLEAA